MTIGNVNYSTDEDMLNWNLGLYTKITSLSMYISDIILNHQLEHIYVNKCDISTEKTKKEIFNSIYTVMLREWRLMWSNVNSLFCSVTWSLLVSFCSVSQSTLLWFCQNVYTYSWM